MCLKRRIVSYNNGILFYIRFYSIVVATADVVLLCFAALLLYTVSVSLPWSLLLCTVCDRRFYFPVHIIAALLHHHLYCVVVATVTLLLLLNCTNMALLLLLLFVSVAVAIIVPYRGIDSIRFDSFSFYGSFACCCTRRINVSKKKQRGAY